MFDIGSFASVREIFQIYKAVLYLIKSTALICYIFNLLTFLDWGKRLLLQLVIQDTFRIHVGFLYDVIKVHCKGEKF